MKRATIYIGLCVGIIFGGIFSAGFASAQGFPAVSIPIYGNWCGLDHPRTFAGALAPIDALDRACMRHDYCAAARGDFDCGCDIGLMRELRATVWGDRKIAGHARAVYDGISIIPCKQPNGMAAKQSMFMADIMRDLTVGKMVPFEVMNRWQRLNFSN